MSLHPTRIRIYVADWTLAPERIREVFRDHGDSISPKMAERLAEFLDYKDPVLAAGLPEWDTERGNPLFHAYQAFAEEFPVDRIPVIESQSRDGRDLRDKGLSIRKTPFRGTVGIPLQEVVRLGTLSGGEFKRPTPSLARFVIRPYDLDGFEAFGLFKEGEDRAIEIGVYPTLEAAHEKADSAAATTPSALFSDDSPGWLVFDNGGKTFDRYALFVLGPEGVDEYALSANADSPQGYFQFVDRYSKKTIPVCPGHPSLSETVSVSPEEIPEGARGQVARILEEYGHANPYGPAVPEVRSPEPG